MIAARLQVARSGPRPPAFAFAASSARSYFARQVAIGTGVVEIMGEAELEIAA
ncbi:MAG TPA: hypothetical protein VF550_21435 [Polyangia bacterium]